MVGVSAERIDPRVERVAPVQPPDPGLMAMAIRVLWRALSLLFNPCAQAGKALPVLWGVSA
jgi:hypothetical protein